MHDDDMSLGDAREWLRRHVKTGARCPCCKQFAKVYHRKINSSMAHDLILMWRAFGIEWGYLPDLRKQRSLKGNREESKLRYWNLVEEESERRPDGGRNGWWRVTPTGMAFVLGESTVPKYAYVYDGRLLKLDGGEYVTIRDALGTKFHYRDLMDDE
jgi:hypothetical protein